MKLDADELKEKYENLESHMGKMHDMAMKDPTIANWCAVIASELRTVREATQRCAVLLTRQQDERSDTE
jgi:hypothetical protein